jgi:hypothetical protein
MSDQRRCNLARCCWPPMTVYSRRFKRHRLTHPHLCLRLRGRMSLLREKQMLKRRLQRELVSLGRQMLRRQRRIHQCRPNLNCAAQRAAILGISVRPGSMTSFICSTMSQIPLHLDSTSFAVYMSHWSLILTPCRIRRRCEHPTTMSSNYRPRRRLTAGTSSTSNHWNTC